MTSEMNGLLTEEQRFLLSSLSDICTGRVIEEPAETLNLEELFHIANNHNVDSLLFSQCREWLGKYRVGSMFRGVFTWHVFYSINRSDMLKEIAERFRIKKIPLICFKGSVFRDYYPVPELRTMGDIDLVIHPADRDKADQILRCEMGFERFIDHHDVWTYWMKEFQFEVHTHMFYDPLANNVDYRAYFDRIWENCHNAPVFGVASENLLVPDEEYHFLYLMTHTAKHIVNSGSGFRAYLDMVLMCRACDGKLNWKRIGEELDNLKLLDFTKTCFRLCEQWFGVEMPLPGNEPERSFAAVVTQKTFKDGTFGLENGENDRAAAARDIKQSGNHYYAGAFKRVLNKLFPSYSDMQLVPWYSFVDGRPWLMPFAWIYRWFYCAVNKFGHSRALLVEPFTKKSEVMNRQAYLKKWGL